jgi:hypothetical protein
LGHPRSRRAAGEQLPHFGNADVFQHLDHTGNAERLMRWYPVGAGHPERCQQPGCPTLWSCLYNDT